MTIASARHLLVATEAECLKIKQQIEAGADFADMARQYSTCPSGRGGGELGKFGPGMMVPEFDQVVFSAPLNTIQGPVQTQFGFHLLEVTSREKSMLASARHLLVASEDECIRIKQQIEAGADFAEMAKKHSTCPSGRDGGELGEFGQGAMVPEFDEVVFSAPLNTVQGPVKTQFGYHLLEVTSRHEIN